MLHLPEVWALEAALVGLEGPGEELWGVVALRPAVPASGERGGHRLPAPFTSGVVFPGVVARKWGAFQLEDSVLPSLVLRIAEAAMD